MLEMRPDYRNAEGASAVTESGTVRVVRRSHPSKRPSGIVVNCDGVLNVKDFNVQHLAKSESPREETEEGTVKEVRLSQSLNA
jgi:hypothetical protein